MKKTIKVVIILIFLLLFLVSKVFASIPDNIREILGKAPSSVNAVEKLDEYIDTLSSAKSDTTHYSFTNREKAMIEEKIRDFEKRKVECIVNWDKSTIESFLKTKKAYLMRCLNFLEGLTNKTSDVNSAIERIKNIINGLPEEIEKILNQETNSIDFKNLDAYISTLTRAYSDNGTYYGDLSQYKDRIYNKLIELKKRKLNCILNWDENTLKTLTEDQLDNYINFLNNVSTDNTIVKNSDKQRIAERVELLKKYKDGKQQTLYGSSTIDFSIYKPSKSGSTSKATTIAGNVLAIIRNIGVVVAAISLAFIGIKYMLGSVEQKAEYKKTMIPFVIGVIMLASSTVLIEVLYKTVSNIFK